MCGPSHWGQLGTLVRAVPCKVYPKETGVSRPKGTWSLVAVLTTLPGLEVALSSRSWFSSWEETELHTPGHWDPLGVSLLPHTHPIWKLLSPYGLCPLFIHKECKNPFFRT